MAHIKMNPVQCRNCGNKQEYPIINGRMPSLTESIAVCNACGFKSIWYMPEIKFTEEEIGEMNKKFEQLWHFNLDS